MTRIAHLTDIHMPPLPKPSLKELASKRILGFLNWYRSRKNLHHVQTLVHIIDDLNKQQTDHIALTGDVVNIALAGEFINSLTLLPKLGSPDKISITPGNHDCYVTTLFNGPLEFWPDYMSSCTQGKTMIEAASPVSDLPSFPYLRLINEIALIGLNSSLQTPPFMAWGHLNQDQLTILSQLLEACREKDLFRLVMVHHPPLVGLTKDSRCLKNAKELENVLIEHGAELVLYGHNHRQRQDQRQTRDGLCHVIGTPSGSICKQRPYDRARYNLFDIKRIKQPLPHANSHSQKWQIKMVGRGLRSDYGGVEEVENKKLTQD